MPTESNSHETPQAFIERLVAWFELGSILERRQLISALTLADYRQTVHQGRFRNLYEALSHDGVFPLSLLQEVFTEGHVEVVTAFQAMRTKLITMSQLRDLFLEAERDNRLLTEVMRAHGIEPPDPPWPGGGGPKTPAPIHPRPDLPSAAAG